MIKVKINKSLTEGGNVFAGKTASIPIDAIRPTVGASLFGDDQSSEEQE